MCIDWNRRVEMKQRWFRLPALAAAAACAVTLFVSVTRAEAQPRVQPTSERAARRLLAVRATAPIKVDGILDEADWARAPAADQFTQTEPREGALAMEPTEVRVLFDDDTL